MHFLQLMPFAILQFSFHQVPITARWAQVVWNEKFVRYFYRWSAVGIEPQTFWSWVQHPTHWATCHLLVPYFWANAVWIKISQWIITTCSRYFQLISFLLKYARFFVLFFQYTMSKKYVHTIRTRVETSTDFATRVPDTRYPMGTRVLVTVNIVCD